MDIDLRVMAGLLAVAFLASGAMKPARPGQKLAASGMGWAAGFTAGTVTGIGALEVLAAAGLTLPAAAGIAPVLVPLAAAGLVLVMAGAFITHARRHEALHRLTGSNGGKQQLQGGRDLPRTTRRKQMSDLQAIADRVEIEALRGEFTDAVMMNDHDRLASLFTPGGAVRIPPATSRPPAGRRSAPSASGGRPSRTTSCKPPTRARSSLTATPRPAAPT
jgi:hypothetical protein